MAVFKIAALQKALDNSVPSPELEKAHKQYINLTVKYRDLLQKDNHLVQRATALEHLQVEKKAYRSVNHDSLVIEPSMSFMKMCLYMSSCLFLS